MKVASVGSFFHKAISLTSSLCTKDTRLTPTELNFLKECCVYNYFGGDLRDVKALSEHLVEKKFFTRKSDTNLYKCKIGIKKWAKTSRGVFDLPPSLNLKEGDELRYSLEITGPDVGEG